MKHQLGLYILAGATVFISMTGCSKRYDTQHTPQPTDTLYTEEKAMAVYANDKQQALNIIDSAQVVGHLTAERADLLRATVYSRTFDSPRLDSAIVIAERLLGTASAKADPSLRENILEVLVYATRQMEDYETQLVYSTQLAETYLQHGDHVEALRTEAEVGALLYRLGKTDEGLSKMDSIIHQLATIRQFNELDASIIAMKRKIGVIRDYPEIATTAHLILERLDDYEQHPADFHDESTREPSDDERPCFIDFYRAQAWAYLAAAYAHMDKPQEARKYISLAEQSDFGQSISGKKMMAPTLRLLGEYDKMEAIYQKLDTIFKSGGDTLTLDYAQMLLDRAKAAEAQGRMSECTALWELHSHVLQKAEERLLQSKANLYAARYHAQEQQMAIDMKQAKLARANIILLLLTVFLVVLLVVMLYILRQQYILRKKDSVLAHEISETIILRDKYEEIMSRTKDASEEAEEQQPVALSSLTDEQLFQHIRKVVIRDELFLDPALDRQALCDRFSLTKEQIGSTFAKGSPFKSVTDFINDCRLPYAAKLLVEHQELSVAEVAHASGFARADTLTSNFKRRYTLTPSQYRAKQQ